MRGGFFAFRGERSEPAEGWAAEARRARPSRLRLRRAERTASCETARPACKAGQPQKQQKNKKVFILV